MHLFHPERFEFWTPTTDFYRPNGTPMKHFRPRKPVRKRQLRAKTKAQRVARRNNR